MLITIEMGKNFHKKKEKNLNIAMLWRFSAGYRVSQQKVNVAKGFMENGETIKMFQVFMHLSRKSVYPLGMIALLSAL